MCWESSLIQVFEQCWACAQVSKNIILGQQAGLLLLSSGDQPFHYSDHSNISFIDNIVIGVQTTPIGVTSGSNVHITGVALQSLVLISECIVHNQRVISSIACDRCERPREADCGNSQLQASIWVSLPLIHVVSSLS